jgi:Zn-dependent protease with chaperone function
MEDEKRAAPAAREGSGARRIGVLESTLPPRYRRQAWLAVAALALFMLLYAALAGWFVRTAWRLSFGGSGDAGGRVFGFLAAACAAVLAAFMIKGLFFIRRGKPEGLTELREAEQPRLFKFLHQLADEAGAPRPHKVYVSARVNAAVFYDLSLLNFLLPSRKNLEIGLSLVNALTLGEVRAVLAHEFGHFAQRSMAVGRWVYIAHQITAQLVSRRDKLDAFVDSLSRSDFRIAWIGWILQTIVWAIRSLIDLAFRGVFLMQQALSREMELQADLVAVSLTGSDALVHALSRLRAADDSFDRAVNFAQGEKARGQPVDDLFELQSRVMKRMAAILDDPLYGRVPRVPLAEPAAHRVFKAELTQPPRMWQSHPLNHEREANAKKTYVAAPLDERSAWVLFDDAPALRQRITRELLEPGEVATAPLAESIARLEARFDRTSLHQRYQGVYFGRSVTRSSEDAESMIADGPASTSDLGELYPKSLVASVEQMRQLERELEQLRALEAGVVEAQGGVIRYRGQDVRRRELPRLIERVIVERDEVRAVLDAHERLVRRAHLAAARIADAVPCAGTDAGRVTHESSLRGLLAAVHYAEHGEAVLRDQQAAMWVCYRMLTAGGKITAEGLQPLLSECNRLHAALAQLHGERDRVTLAPAVLARLDSASWSEALGGFDLPTAGTQNIQKWLEVIDGWVGSAANACSALRNAALDELLLAEHALAAHVREGAPAPAPVGACLLPAGYRRLLLSQEQARKVTLTPWQRFLRASGRGPAFMRLAVAAGIVGTVLAVGANIGQGDLVIYNGLSVPLRVQVGGTVHEAFSGYPVHVSVDAESTLPITTTTTDGRLVEHFDAKVGGAFGTQVYNVAGASPLVRWTAVYGPASAEPMAMLGAPRLVEVSVDNLFEDPPQSVSTKHGEGAVRHVLRGFAGASPEQVLGMLRSNPAEMRRVALAHARWDVDQGEAIETWFAAAEGDAGAAAAVAERLALSPESVPLRRIEQYLAPAGAARAAACARDQARAKERPEDGDRAYVAIRCDLDDTRRDAGFIAAHARWPANAWLAYGAAWAHAADEHWSDAIAAFEQSRQSKLAVSEQTLLAEARILRYVDNPGGELPALVQRSERLAKWLAIEQPGFQPGPGDGRLITTYAGLAQGSLDLPAPGGDVERADLARLTRLVAASDGAPAELVQRALALPVKDGLDGDTVWPSLGLALRRHQDLAGLERALTDPTAMTSASTPEHLRRMWAQVVAAAEPGAHPLTPADLHGLDPEERGHVYAALAVALGSKAPAAYRVAANRFLFVTERPFLRTSTNPGTHS